LKVELRVHVVVPRPQELGIEDTANDTDLLCGLTKVLATHDELAVYIPEEVIEGDGRQAIGIIGFQAFRRENAFVDDDFAGGGGDRHDCANFKVLLIYGTRDILAELAYMVRVRRFSNGAVESLNTG
jgi:hypothetical protein